MKPKLLIEILLILLVSACSSKIKKQSGENAKPQNSSLNNYNESYQNSSSNYSNEESYEVAEIANDDYSNGCRFEDGTYSATYTLDVEVEDCQVVQINFPNDGYLDEDHISYADIDENGNASIEGEDGKSYEIQIDN